MPDKNISGNPETDQTANGVTRRDFVGSTLIGAGAALLFAQAPSAMTRKPKPLPWAVLGKEWDGPGGVGDYAASNGNTASVVNAAHSVRDGYWNKVSGDVRDLDEEYDLVVVGGGLAGLMSCYEFLKQHDGKKSVLMIDNHPIFGGEAKQNEIDVDGYRLHAAQGSNVCLWPAKRAEEMELMFHPVWNEIGLPRGDEPDAPTWITQPEGVDVDLGIARDNFTAMLIERDRAKQAYVFPATDSDGKRQWAKNPWENGYAETPWSKEVREEMVKVESFVYDGDKSYKEFTEWLDTMTYKEYLTNVVGITRPEIFDYLNPQVASHGTGLGCDTVSAYAAKAFFGPGLLTAAEAEFFEQMGPIGLSGASFPGGNGGIARHFVKKLLPDAIEGEDRMRDILYGDINWDAFDNNGQALRMRLGATVIDVRHEGAPDSAEHVQVTYIENESNEPLRVRARSVIMAGGQWMNKHVLRDAPEHIGQAMSEFHHAPMMIVNVAVRHWRYMVEMGVSSTLWLDDFGWFTNIRGPISVDGEHAPLDPDKPAILSFYMPFTDYVSDKDIPHAAQCIAARTALFAMPFSEIEAKIRKQLSDTFGPYGFDDDRDIAGIITNRWGHAYVVPQPGFFFGRDGQPAPRDIVRQGYGRVRFGHSELSGEQMWPTACSEGQRAAQQVAELV